MKKIVYFLFAILFINCNNQPKKKTSSPLHLFQTLSKDSIKIIIPEDLQIHLFSKEKLIPLAYQEYFLQLKTFDWTENTTLLPVGKVQIKPNEYLLIVTEQYDYGIRTYGLLYDEIVNKTTDTLTLARTFQDAEASQTISSTIKNNSITQKTETCLAELDWLAQPIEIISSECNDEIKTIKVSEKLSFIRN